MPGQKKIKLFSFFPGKIIEKTEEQAKVSGITF